MSVLSEWDIIKQLGTSIVILPFKEKKDSLRGCCISLTASEYAYVFTKENNESNQPKEVERLEIKSTQLNNNYLTIPKRKTAILWTNEFIFLSNLFCGSLHSKVSLVSKGLGHIGTRVNPNWGGIMAVAIHNLSDNDVDIEIGETIAYLRVYKLCSKSSSPRQLDDPGKMKDAIPSGFAHPKDLEQWLEYRHKEWNTSDEKTFYAKFKNWHEYQDIKNELYDRNILYKLFLKPFKNWALPNWLSVMAIAISILTNIDKILVNIRKIVSF